MTVMMMMKVVVVVVTMVEYFVVDVSGYQTQFLISHVKEKYPTILKMFSIKCINKKGTHWSV